MTTVPAALSTVSDSRLSGTALNQPGLDWTEASARLLSKALSEPGVLLDRRLEAVKRLKTTPWPNAVDESWRRTDPRLVGRKQFRLFNPFETFDPDGLDKAGDDILSEFNEDASLLRLANGRAVRATLTRTAQDNNVVFGDLDSIGSGRLDNSLVEFILDVIDDDDSPALTLSNLAYYQGGSALLVPSERCISQPFILQHTVRIPNVAFFPMNLIHIGERSRVTLVMDTRVAGEDLSWYGGLNRIRIDAGARLDLIVVNRSTPSTRFYDQAQIEMGRDARLNLSWIDLTTGWSVLRREITSCEPGSEVDLSGLFIGADNAHYDLRTRQIHHAPSTLSKLLYKAALFGRSKSVFQGLINVGKDAVGVNAYQLNRNLLMDAQTTADSIPKLEIEVDEVKCSHGVSTGKIDREALFYMMSRGLSLSEATGLLVESFLKDTASWLQDSKLITYWKKNISSALEQVLNRSRTDQP